MNIIAKKCWPEYTYNMVMLGRCNVAAVEPQIYGVKKNGQHLSCSYQQTNQDWYWEKWRWSQRKAGHQTHTTNTVYQKCQKLRQVLEISTIKTTHLTVHRNNTYKVPLKYFPFLVPHFFCCAQLWQPSCGVLFCLR